MKYLYLLVFSLLSLNYGHSQKLLRALEKAKNSVQNTTRTASDHEESNETANMANTFSKSAFHSQNQGKIVFAKGAINPQLEDPNAVISTLDLSQPFFANAYLDAPLYTTKAQHEKINEYDIVMPHVIRNYYIDGTLIASYHDAIEDTDFKEKIVLSTIVVPSSDDELQENKFRLSTLAHVFSALSAGNHQFKVEYQVNVSHPISGENGSAAITYENKPVTVASGEVTLQITPQTLLTYCKKYSRPKFSKGVLEGNGALEKQLMSLIKANKGHQPIYVYADDNWILRRGSFDRVISREVQVYYIFTNKTGRCEMANFLATQSYDGKTYYAPKEGLNKEGPGFKYVACQQYQ